MLRANALFIVIIVSLIIGMFCTSIIAVSYFQRVQVQKDILIKKVELNAYSGINILLADRGEIPWDEQKTIDLYGEENDTVVLKKMLWGIFEIGTVSSFAKNIMLTKSVVYGYEVEDRSRAIYLPDQNSPLVLAGNTMIQGDCYLPEKGAKRGYIEGQPFAGANLVNGTIKKSQYSLPELDKQMVERISAALGPDRTMLSGDFEHYTGELKDTIIRSFAEKTLVIESVNGLSLKKKCLSGNIIIRSDKVVEIDSSSRLTDILIFADAVNVTDYFTGNIQLFAKDSIKIGKNCFMKYPSVLGLIKKNVNEKQPFILISADSKVKGVVFSYNEIGDLHQTLITLESKSEVEGQVYAQGSVDCKGSIFGSVVCSKFMLKTPSSVYENHLLNAVIDAEKLSPYYVGSSLILAKKKKDIIKWME